MDAWIANDYYSVLGVTKSADIETIKKAYKGLVRVHHPDLGGSGVKFKEIVEAYQVLKDPEIREQYDTVRTLSTGSTSHVNNGAFLDLFKEAFLEGFHEGVDLWKKGKLNGERGHDITTKLTINEDELTSSDIVKTITLVHHSGCVHCIKGCEHCEDGWVTEEKTVNVRVPKTVKNGERLKIAQAGGSGETTNGDLYIKVIIKPSESNTPTQSEEKLGEDDAGYSENGSQNFATQNVENLAPPKANEDLDSPVGEPLLGKVSQERVEPFGEPKLATQVPQGEESLTKNSPHTPASSVSASANISTHAESVTGTEDVNPLKRDEEEAQVGEINEDGGMAVGLGNEKVQQMGNIVKNLAESDETAAFPSVNERTSPPPVELSGLVKPKVLHNEHSENVVENSGQRVSTNTVPDDNLPPMDGDQPEVRLPPHPPHVTNKPLLKSRGSVVPPPRRSPRTQAVPQKEQEHNSITLKVDPSNLGTPVNITSPRGEELSFVIPANVKNGQILRVKNKGQVNPDTLQVEDLLIQVELK